jgi:hypothetical protein
MTIQEKDIKFTLNQLIVLHRQQQVFKNVWTAEQLNTLQIKKEHVIDAGLTIPIFLNTLEEIAKKGYLSNTPIIDQKHRNQLADVKAGKHQTEITDLLLKVDTIETQEKLKAGIAKIFRNTLPHDYEFNEAGFMASEINIEDLMTAGMEAFTDTTDLVAVVVIMPFRSIERLLSKMNEGIAFNEVKDPGLWHDASSYTLFFNDQKYLTKYRNDPIKAHFVFQVLFSKPTETLDFNSIPDAESNKVYFDSLSHFIEKHPDLEPIFAITSSSITINQDYLKDVH